MEDDIDIEFRNPNALQKIHAGIQRAAIIIENLLRFARPSAKSNVTLIDLRALIEETLTLVSNQARIQKIEVSCDFSERAAVLPGASALLQQVFMNLFLNAINAMPDGGRLSIHIALGRGEVLVRIADSGKGISHADIDKIFDPFYTTSPVGKGSGLGLSICYSIVRHHFGSIEVESVEGRAAPLL